MMNDCHNKKTSYSVRAKVDDNTRDKTNDNTRDKTNDGALPMFLNNTNGNVDDGGSPMFYHNTRDNNKDNTRAKEKEVEDDEEENIYTINQGKNTY